MARPGWPACGRWPDRRQVARRIVPAAPRSAGPGLGRAKSPPAQSIEHKFDSESRTLRSPTGPLRSWVGRGGAATGRNLADSKGQQETTNLEVSGRFERSTWGAKLLDWAFTRRRPQERSWVRGLDYWTAKPVCGRQHQRPMWGTTAFWQRSSNPPVEGVVADPTRWRVRGGPLPSTGA